MKPTIPNPPADAHVHHLLRYEALLKGNFKTSINNLTEDELFKCVLTRTCPACHRNISKHQYLCPHRGDQPTKVYKQYEELFS